MYQAIVFLPLLGAILPASFAGRRHARCPGGPPVDTGHRHAPVPHGGAHEAGAADHAHSADDELEPAQPPQWVVSAELITTTLLVIAMVLSWIALWRVGFGHQDARDALMPFIVSGDLKVDWSLRVDTLTAVMLVVVTTVSALVHLYSIGYMARRSVPAALLRLSVAVHLRHADAGDGRQPRAAVLRLGGRRPRVLSADRLLVPQARRPTPRRSRPSSSTASAISASRSASSPSSCCSSAVEFDTIFAAGAGAGRQDHPFLRLARRRADPDLPAAVHGRDGQVGAVPAAHLAARRHGGPDAGLGADPCRHHGDGRRLHGGAAVAAVRARADRARPSSPSSARPPRSSPRPSAWCRTTSSA